MKLNQKEFMEHVNKILADRTDDEALAFIEDCKDTIAEDKNDWKTKYDDLLKEKEELDKSWRTKYKERFFSSDNSLDETEHENNNKTNPAKPKDDKDSEEIEKLEQAEKVRFDDLFKEDV